MNTTIPQCSSPPTAVTGIVNIILAAHPATQAIYLYGTWGTEHQRRDSDVDIGVLLPVETAHVINLWDWGLLSVAVSQAAKVERADLVNLRDVSTTLCKEVIAADRRIYCADVHATDEFEMLTLSFYQKLNAERAEIRKEIIASGRVLA